MFNRSGKEIFVYVLICFFMMGGVALSADVAKIGIINFQKILKSSNAGKKAQAEITKKGKALEKKLAKIRDDIQALKKKIERDALVMSPEKRNEKEREFRIKINDFKESQKKFTNEFKKFEEVIIQKIQKEVFELVEKIGKKEGYLLIIERNFVVYMPNSLDITEHLIKLYNKQK